MSMQSLMQQAQKMQRELQKAKAVLEKTEFTGSNGGAVKAMVLGNREIAKIDIDDAMLNKEDKEMLQEMIKLAINDAMKKIVVAEAEMNERITGQTRGLGL